MTEISASPRADNVTSVRDQPLGGHSLRLVMLVLAFACGASVANLYYAQPLLGLIRDSFGISAGTAALVVTVTQAGYAAGLALLLPLGDLLENRKLASRTLVVTAVALAAAAAAPSFGAFLAAAALVGVTSVVAQVLVPLAAHLAPAGSQGKYVGQVTGGLLLGIMLARSVSSLAAAAWGWQSIYAISAAVMVVTALALALLLPRRQPAHSATYPQLVASTVAVARAEPVLRRRAAAQALMFGAFTVYWTAIAYELTGGHHLSQGGVAVFALVGAAGAGAAPVAGRLGDRGYGRPGGGRRARRRRAAARRRRRRQPRTARGLGRPARLRRADEPCAERARHLCAASRGPGEDQFRLHDQPLRRRGSVVGRHRHHRAALGLGRSHPARDDHGRRGRLAVAR